VGRGDTDAPEVDLVARIRGGGAAVGERLRVVVEGLDGEANLVCRPARRAAPR
jgi:hypothetical protein